MNAPGGQYPGGEPFTATDCDGVTSNVITLLGYAGEYSLVNVTEGETYIFTSGTSDFITISTDDGVTLCNIWRFTINLGIKSYRCHSFLFTLKRSMRN
ncbi:hypothetical protein H9X57_02695 [Flavobacterium piscinae]|uniref:hypothetical protein n=1 Tax=Flavobacterium piscinae TaxID=2506424 RepID=UPI0019AC39CE|nr:hypothetical protein [Flavobacterium piscinae]MBC8882695.1 hypothetical protein [Flavobacterium piscinae]